jgi:putative ABC transport system permease protein
VLRLLTLFTAHRARGRMALSVAGIALGVALGYGVHLVNRTAVADVAAAVRSLAGEADLEVRGARSGFPETLYPRIAQLPGVAVASPALELQAGIAGGERVITLTGIDILRAALLQPQLVAEDRGELLAPDRVFLSAAAADSLGLGKGDELQLVSGQQTIKFKVAGIASSLRGISALTDIATAQWRFGRLGELNRIDVRLKPGADPQQALGRIRELLPPGVHATSLSSLEEASGYPSRSYRVNMNVLAMVALFTGGFLVFSAQALEMARRRGEHALLRVLGLKRPQLTRLVLAEAALLGAIGALLGLALGYAMALAAVRAAGADLGAGMFGGVSTEVRLSIEGAAAYFVAGVGVALLGAFLPALDAARTPPARALKAGDEQTLFERVTPLWPGLLLLAAGAALSRLGSVDGLPVFGYAAIACLLLGSIALVPRIAQAVFALLPLPSNPALALALGQLRSAPGQAAVSLAAIVASFSLMAAMAIMVASFRESVHEWLEAVLPAELYFRTTHAGDTAQLAAGFEERVRALPQVARAEFLRSGRLLLDPARPPLVLVARDRAERAFPAIGRRYERKTGDPTGVWVSEAVADLYGFAPGQRLELPILGRNHPVVVAGIFRDYARQHGAVLIDRADYVALTGDRTVNDGALWLSPGTSAAAATDALRALPGGAQLDISDPGEIRDVSMRIFDRSFAVTYAMEAVAFLVGLFGLSSSLGAIVLARRREFGVLRHLGLTRAQIRIMLAAEGGLLALVGAAAGLAAGAAISLVLVYVVNRQSFHWSMELHPPYLLLLSLTGILIGLAVLTAVISGREATGMGPVRAVREDW